jgi:two-component system sensor histidine kinase KdpD
MSGRWTGYAWAVAAALACTLAGWAMSPRFDLVNVAMVYLLGVVLVALRFSRGPAILASALSVAAFDVLFVPPRGTLTVDDVQYLLTFAIMLAVGLVISTLVERERRRARAQAALAVEAETERIRSALLASISHDLRTPLAVMSGASSTLAERGERLPPQERQALARSVYEQAREMSERVAKLLQMTRLDVGAIELNRDWGSIAEIVESAVARLGERLAGHRLIIEVPGDLPLVQVDSALIEQALGNLLENAARHTPAGTVVRVRAKVHEGTVVVSVEDYGGGASAVDVERIFRKFHDGSIEGAVGGVGLGLAICRAIVRLHGGHAWAETVPMGGMAFRFSLPLGATPPASDAVPEPDDGTARDPSRR